MAFPILFAGTADIGVALLRALAKDERFEVKQVITSPDRPAGRKLELTPSHLKKAALELGLPLFQPENINAPEALESIKNTKAVSLVVMAYGQLFKKDLLESFPQECLNLHTSLLPQYRGASPIQSALFNQEKTTGVSLMQMVQAMDAGPVFAMLPVEIEAHDTSVTLTEKLAQKTAEEIPEMIHRVLSAQLESKEQDEARATYCKKITKEEGFLDWSEGAKELDAKIRAFYGWPGTFTLFEGRRLKIIRTIPHSIESNREPGMVYEEEGKILVQTGQGSLQLVELQLEGKKRQSWSEFLNGNPGFVGMRLE